MTSLFEAYLAYEANGVNRLLGHPVLKSIAQLSDRKYQQLLLQLGHLSLEFVRWYECAKLSLNDERAKEVVRSILRDEIPGAAGMPTHQDNRLTDYEQIGIRKANALRTKASPVTQRVLKNLYACTRHTTHTEHDLRVLISLRCAGERAVGEIYALLVAENERRFGLLPAQSVFFEPHRAHDALGASHTVAFLDLLIEHIQEQSALAIAKSAAHRAFALRRSFFEQFIPT